VREEGLPVVVVRQLAGEAATLLVAELGDDLPGVDQVLVPEGCCS
jgi:hypothetical protein